MKALLSLLLFISPHVWWAGPQYARPDSDVTTATNVVTTPASQPLYSVIDETAASLTDYIGFSTTSVTRTIEVGLSNVTDPNVSTGHILRYTYGRGGTASSPTIQFMLYQGTTLIANSGTITITTSPATTGTSGSLTLTSAEADAITDYTDLRIRVTMSATTNTGARWYWAELEVPDVSRRRIINL